MKMREFIQENIREIMVWFIIGIISLYILVSISMNIWMKLIVIAVLIFGGFEVMAQMHGKSSPSKTLREGFRKGSQDFQKSMKEQRSNAGLEFPQFELPDFDLLGEKKRRNGRRSKQ